MGERGEEGSRRILEEKPKRGILDWKPNPKQRVALQCSEPELFYGGAKGGGKSDFLLADYTYGLQWGPRYHGIIFRRTFPEQEELMRRAWDLYNPIGEFAKTERLWTFSTGSTLRFRYIDNDDDVKNYQGHQYQWIGWDELTSWPNDYAYIFMFSINRSADGLPCRIRATGNPGMPGHLWCKARFIDVAPPTVTYQDPITKKGRVFIPASLDDNEYLLNTDYESNLMTLPEHLYRAFRKGDWDVVVGQVFAEFRRAQHVVRPFPLEPSWPRFASMDWGYAKPFSIGWWAITHEGRMVRYMEWYGKGGKPNEGIRMEATEVARVAFERSVRDGCKDIVMDRACWNRQGTGISVAEIFHREGWNTYPSNSDRMNGLAAVHDRLKTIGHDGQPMMLIFDTCQDWTRTVPIISADPRKPEDVDTTSEDHCYDDTRYACVSDFARRRVNHPVRARYRSGVHEPDYDPKTWKGHNPLAN